MVDQSYIWESYGPQTTTNNFLYRENGILVVILPKKKWDSWAVIEGVLGFV